jgi:hypothetical protein
MQEHVRATCVELVEERRQLRVTGIAAEHVAQQRNAVEGEHVERMVHLGQRAFDIRQGHDREPGEAPIVRRDLRSRRVVHEPRQVVGKRLVTEGHARWRQREDRGVDGVRIHEREGALRRPLGQRERQKTPVAHLGVVLAWREVHVRVDPHARGFIHVTHVIR